MKTKKIEIRLTEHDKELWDKQAAQYNLSMSDYIRMLVTKDLISTKDVQK